eukprot:7444111-Pyramimonas_sp.AAC.1
MHGMVLRALDHAFALRVPSLSALPAPTSSGGRPSISEMTCLGVPACASQLPLRGRGFEERPPPAFWQSVDGVF